MPEARSGVVCGVLLSVKLFLINQSLFFFTYTNIFSCECVFVIDKHTFLTRIRVETKIPKYVVVSQNSAGLTSECKCAGTLYVCHFFTEDILFFKSKIRIAFKHSIYFNNI